MRAVHVRVRHDHDAVIPQAGRVKLVTLSRRMIVDRSVGGDSKTVEHGGDRRGGKGVVSIADSGTPGCSSDVPGETDAQ